MVVACRPAGDSASGPPSASGVLSGLFSAHAVYIVQQFKLLFIESPNSMVFSFLLYIVQHAGHCWGCGAVGMHVHGCWQIHVMHVTVDANTAATNNTSSCKLMRHASAKSVYRILEQEVPHAICLQYSVNRHRHQWLMPDNTEDAGTADLCGHICRLNEQRLDAVQVQYSRVHHLQDLTQQLGLAAEMKGKC